MRHSFNASTLVVCAAFGLSIGACSSSGGSNMDGGSGGSGGKDGGPTTELPNPVHASAGADVTTADGSEEHPFPTLAAASSAILAHTAWTGELIVHPGTKRYELSKTVLIPATAKFTVLPGTTIALGPDISLHVQNDMKLQGEVGNEITFTWLVENSRWGGVTNFEETSKNNIVEYVIFEHGGETTFANHGMRGALSIWKAAGRFAHNEFRFNEGDDGFNISTTTSLIEYNYFHDNFNDCLDSDGFDNNEIRFNRFVHCGNDGVDLGQSKSYVHDNVMIGSGDKGVSLGEMCNGPRIENNLIVGCNIGIGIKDSSSPVIVNNTLYGNNVGVACYEAVQGMGSCKASFSNGIIWNSLQADVVITPDTTGAPGMVTFAYSCIQSGSYVKDLATAGATTPLTGTGLLSAAAGCADPGFAAPGTVPNPVAMVGTAFVPGDFHLKSTAGRFVPDPGTDVLKGEITGTYTNDAASSVLLDKGDPATSFAMEPAPNGGRVDLGTYGGSKYASHSSN